MARKVSWGHIPLGGKWNQEKFSTNKREFAQSRAPAN